MNQMSCAITGHRPGSFPWKYDETNPDCILLKKALETQIMALTDHGVTDWLSGMALGVDVWAAEIVLKLRKKNPAVRLHCILPCEEQDINWAHSARERYHSILGQADKTVYVGRQYTSTCMLRRNRYLVEHSSLLLAVYNGTVRSGTGATVRYAQRLGREIIIIEPISRIISCDQQTKADH